MSDKRVAVVTGANRCIGHEIARQLAKKPGTHVVLTARDETKGRAAAEGLRKQGLDVEFMPLDVTDERSARRFFADLAAAHGRCDVLVNTLSPGWVRTGMGGSGAPRSVEQGADTAVWLATLPENGPTGGFFMDRRSIPW